MHVINGVWDPAATFPFPSNPDDRNERRQANHAVAIGALGLAVTGLIEVAIATLSGSVALLGDALHDLSDVSTSVRLRPCRSPCRHRLCGRRHDRHRPDLIGKRVATMLSQHIPEMRSFTWSARAG